MDGQDVVQRVSDLSDVELAMLLSLVAKEHCIIQTDTEAIDELETEIRLIATNVFGLSCTSIQCSEATTLEDFTHSLLIDKPTLESPTTPKYPISNRRASAFKFERSYSNDRYQIANIFIAKCINVAAHHIQMQALELLRTHRIFTHTDVYAVPEPFLLVVLNPISSRPLSKHLNDFLFLSHFHGEDEGFPNSEESAEWVEDSKVSISSVVHRTSPTELALVPPIFSAKDLERLTNLSKAVVMSTDVKRHMHDVLTFLRFHRCVSSGVSPKATRHLDLLVRCLATLHGISFVTPSLVGLATRKVYMHRLTLTSEHNERSLQYGSDNIAVGELLAETTVEMVIEEVLMEVEVPL